MADGATRNQADSSVPTRSSQAAADGTENIQSLVGSLEPMTAKGRFP